MLYQLQFSKHFPNEDLAGKNFEIFSVSWAEDHWIRDENGEAWGYDHPTRGECVRIPALGKGKTPDLSKKTIGYQIVEINPEDEPQEYRTIDELLNDLGLERDEVTFFPSLFDDEVKRLGPGDEENE